MVFLHLVLGVAFVSYWAALTIYRLFLHPLARFPGPKLPACTSWYEFYYDVILRGQMIWQVQKWHEEYGPIIRIAPNELHILDADYYDEIYGSQIKKRDKSAAWVKMSGPDHGSIFSTVTHDHHRLRRNALNPFFSRKAVISLESLIHEKISILVNRFRQACKTGEVIRIDVAYTALTADIIGRYTYAADGNYLLEDDFKLEWKQTLTVGFESGPLMRQLPWLGTFMQSLPDPIVAKIVPPLYQMNTWRATVMERARRILASDTSSSDYSHPTLFHELRDGSLPPKEKSVDRLVDEVQTLTGAGSETTAQTLAYLTYYLISNPKKLERLRGELKSAMPRAGDIVSHTVIEQLPYTRACVSEGLRLSYGVTTRLPRVAPKETLQYKQWKILPGTPVSATAYFTLMNPAIFPCPEQFLPERWLPEETPVTSSHVGDLRHHLVNFGRGTRQCIGINLAYAELYLTVSQVFRRFRMTLYETTIDDLICKHDFFVAHPKLDTKGIRVRFVEELYD